MSFEEAKEGLEKGRYLTISCSRYEETIWKKDGCFHSTMEDGVSDGRAKINKESTIDGLINRAINNPNEYDIFWDFGT